jgi:sugar (pentulose or hexulose) kinase
MRPVHGREVPLGSRHLHSVDEGFMSDSLRHLSPQSVITGWDFSTSGVKCLAFDIEGDTLADVRLPTDLWTQGGVSELNILQLEGQARASVRAIADKLRKLGRLGDWIAGGISATHHTSGRIDANRNQVRRAICWNDHSLAEYHAIGLKRLGGQKKVRDLIGGPWAIRYTLSHLVKDEITLSESDWRRTARIAQHGVLAAGFLTGNFDVVSVSGAASTGIMDLRTGRWRREMLNVIANEQYRELAWQQLPRIVDHYEPVGPLSDSLAIEAGLETRPIVFPTSDDQQAGLIGGGAVDSGQMAIILGTSAVVNSSSSQPPKSDRLDAMRLNWGPHLWMRCYNNGAMVVNHVAGADPDWPALEALACEVAAGCEGVSVAPFLFPEPSLGVASKSFGWEPKMPREPGKKLRAALEALAYLIALGVEQHERDGQAITRITVSGGIAKNRLMCEILATVLDRPLELLVSDEGPALGAAVTALAALENHRRRQAGETDAYPIADAVGRMVRFREPVQPRPEWRAVYARGAKEFGRRVGALRKKG